jgi:hypothetical protein
MPNDITGSYHAIPLRPARVWTRVPHHVPRRVQIIAQLWGLTRGAKPPPGVVWRRAMLAMICKLLVMGLILLSLFGPR